jgi:ribosome-associated protein
MDLPPRMNLEPTTGHSSPASQSNLNAGNLKQNSLKDRTLNESAAPATNTANLSSSMSSAEEVAACLEVVRLALADVKAQNIVELDVQGISNVSDVLVIASGTSTRHVKALANNVSEECKKAGFRPIGMEGERDAEWILVDFGLVVVHVMLPTARTFYDLESLWKPKA